MTLHKLRLLFETLRHLKFRQVFYRGYYLARKRLIGSTLPITGAAPFADPLWMEQPVRRAVSLRGAAFTFLNRTHDFNEKIDWDFSSLGKLWCYNLNYFDFLNQEGMGKDEGLRLIHDFLSHTGPRSIGYEPYPTSLRIINWVKFISRHGVTDSKIDKGLYAQSLWLGKNLEYHLLGNHLLENAFALLFAASFFSDGKLYRKARKILVTELAEQLLPDGAHFELSPMYHQILLDRLLDCVNLLKNSGLQDNGLSGLFEEKASIMLGWLGQITFLNGDIPLVNDAAFGIAPITAALSAYAARLEVVETVLPLKESGYRKITRGSYEMVVDVGDIGPDYIPGHAHSDTFGFVLYRDAKPLIVDTGTSTYETCERRLTERRTAAHNTVQLDGVEQSEVWGGFRVARRAYVRELKETEDSIIAYHTGYRRIGARHRREFTFEDKGVVITDTVESRKSHACCAYLHFHPNVRVSLVNGSISADGALITFSGASAVRVEDYLYAPQFNVLQPAMCVKVTFDRELKTSILPDTGS